MGRDLIQVGVIGIRDPADRYTIIKTIPIFEEVTPQILAAEAATHRGIAKVLAEKMRQYIDGGGTIGRERAAQVTAKGGNGRNRAK